MNPKHCVSLGIARQLKEAGWEERVEFYYEENAFQLALIPKSNARYWEKDYVYPGQLNNKWNAYPAPIATELLEELPREVSIKQYPENDSVRYQVGHNADKIGLQTFKYNNNLCDALAEMWLYLKEKGLLCPKSTGGIT